ncbi:MAG: hypothetical protein HY827_07875 [Actinobacteria bacterium]|nr:hypothetical protein [Actinomycetota bacterium]
MLFAAGCGGDDKPSGTETGKGATAGVPGDEAGGVTVEAGKIRDPKEVEQEKKNFSEEPPPVQILTGSTTGFHVDKATAIVAKTTAEFRAMMKKHFSHGVKKQTIAPIDFKSRQANGLFLPKSPKGSQLAITDVHQEGDTVVISAVRLLNGKGCSTAPGRPRLFHIVETRKMADATKTQIKLSTQTTTPCE